MVARPVTANVNVSDAMLLNAGKDQDNWLLNGRTYDNQRYSPLKKINPGNVGHLAPVAIVQTGVANSFEATPLVVDGVMYVSTPGDHVLAYDAASGEPLWSYTPRSAVQQSLLRSAVARGCRRLWQAVPCPAGWHTHRIGCENRRRAVEIQL